MRYIMPKKLLLAVVLCGLAFPPTASAQSNEGAMRFPSPQSERPIPCIALSKYVAEKSPLGDPLAEASKKLVGAASVVFRPTPVAYTKMTVSDPFENRHLLQMPAAVPEEPMPPLLLPKK
jgi:hypothetical protein